MKLRLVAVAGILLATPMLSISVVRAQTAQPTTTSTETETVQTQTERKQRIEQRKQALKTVLTQAERVKIQGKCKNSQGKLSSVSGRINGIETSRAKVYENLVNRLTSLEEKLKAKNVDTTKLVTEIDTLKTKILTYATDLVAYKQAVADTSKLDCAADPVAFKASLEASRTALEKVKADGLDIRNYVNQTIKPTLKEIRASLEKTGSTDDNTTGGTN